MTRLYNIAPSLNNSAATPEQPGCETRREPDKGNHAHGCLCNPIAEPQAMSYHVFGYVDMSRCRLLEGPLAAAERSPEQNFSRVP